MCKVTVHTEVQMLVVGLYVLYQGLRLWRRS